MANVLERVPVREQDPKVRATNFEEVCYGYNKEEAMEEASRCINCKNAQCVKGCPVAIQIPQFIEQVKNGNIEEAYRIISESSALPAVCGRVCPQESQCEGKCIRGFKGDPISIGKLERFVADWARENGIKPTPAAQKNGKKVAVIGSGPAGLTCAGDLAKMGYDVTIFEALHEAGGDVMVDGENVKNYTKEELCNKVGVVQQRAVLFKGSIRDNMKWGKEDATDAEIWEALTTAQAKEVVEGKQDQLDFMLEQNGKNLSGGQKQRLSIARALVKKPEILILDDSSSALDFATDAKLRKAVHNLEGNTTTFLVSQRIAGIRQADQILVLGNGTLEGNGTHDELMKTCEVYREIYFSQFPEERAAYNNESGVIA